MSSGQVLLKSDSIMDDMLQYYASNQILLGKKARLNIEIQSLQHTTWKIGKRCEMFVKG